MNTAAMFILNWLIVATAIIVLMTALDQTLETLSRLEKRASMVLAILCGLLGALISFW